MSTHAEIVLAAIVSKEKPRRELLAKAAVKLSAEHFYNEIHRNIYKLLMSYYDRTGEVMPSHIFTKALEDANLEAAKVLAYSQAFLALEEMHSSEADFLWSVDEIRSEYAKRQTGIAFTEAMEILERGYDVGRERFEGHEDARRYLYTKLTEIDHLAQSEQVPEGDVFDEYSTVLQDYYDRKSGTNAKGVKLGLRTIDDVTGGVQRGELILAAGYAGTGKSQFAVQAAWDVCVYQGQNCFFGTTETVRDQVIRRILSRHSRLPMFGKPEGINAKDIKNGTLSAEDEKILFDVLDDWKNNSTYGKLHLIQIPRGATIGYYESKLKEFGRENEVGLAVMDYLALLSAEKKRASEREELNEILKGSKLVATSFQDGKGVPLLSPWQLNREGQKSSVAQGFYTMQALSDTSEAEKSADQIITFYREQENTKDMRVQFLKVRDDALPAMHDVAIDFRTSYIGPMHSANSYSPSTNFNSIISQEDDLMKLLQGGV